MNKYTHLRITLLIALASLSAQPLQSMQHWYQSRPGKALISFFILGTGYCLYRYLFKNPALRREQERLNKSLLEACIKGDLEDCKKLLKDGAKVNATSKSGKSPLYIACSKGYIDIMRYLLEQGADPNIATKVGKTALHAACKNDDPLEMVQLLLDYKAQVNKQTLKPKAKTKQYKQATPLHYLFRHQYKKELALSEKLKKTIQLLLDAGADVDLADASGKTFFELVCSMWPYELEVLEAVAQKTKHINTATPIRPFNKMFATLKHTGVQTPLMRVTHFFWCIKKKGPKYLEQTAYQAIECLLKHGAKITGALSIACRQGNKIIADYLLSNKDAQANETLDGETPLHTVALCVANGYELPRKKWSRDQYLGITELLINKDPSSKNMLNKKKQTPLEILNSSKTPEDRTVIGMKKLLQENK